ncbi:MAG: DNA adenine methylase, partial [Pseudomonadota bacterium]
PDTARNNKANGSTCARRLRRESYVEPFGGGAGLLLARPRVRLEVYNDLAGEMVALFRVIRDRPDELVDLIEATPFAREEHAECQDLGVDNDLELARRVLVRSHLGHGSNGIFKSTGFRGAGMRAGKLPVHLWADFPDVIRQTAQRMRGVVIECRPAEDVLCQYDGPNVLHYVDPPYVLETRGRRAYKHEMSDDDHAKLIEVLRTLEGSVVLSGYAHSIYDDALHDWRRVEISTYADQALPRNEIVWMNFDDEAPLFRSAAS